MRNKSILGFALSASLGIAAVAMAQQPPPFNGGGTGFDPEVGVVQSGAQLDATATVSADRRYVTITPRADNSDLLALRLFAVQQTNLGFVGGVNPGGGAGGGAGAGGAGAGGAGAGGAGAGGAGGAGAGASAMSSSPTAIANRGSILNREGMFLLAPLR